MGDDGEAVAPRWFVEALAAPVETGLVRVDGADIAYRAWGAKGNSGVMLVHGGRAHSRWWDHIAPLLADHHRVVALDLSGHGDSDHRLGYGYEVWAREVLAVTTAAAIAGPPVLVGHSMGGLVSWWAAHHHGESLAGVVLLDSPIRDRSLAEEVDEHGSSPQPKGKAFASMDEALARFRLIPAQQDAEPFVIDHIARHSLRQGVDGWVWKFDTLGMKQRSRAVVGNLVPHCRVAYFRSEHGVVSDELLARMRVQFGRGALVADLPAAGHHPMIDRPLAVVAGVRTVLAAWEPDGAIPVRSV